MADTGKDSQGAGPSSHGETSSAIVDVGDGPFGVGAGNDRSVAKMAGQPINFLKNYVDAYDCLLYTSPSPRDLSTSRMPSSA